MEQSHMHNFSISRESHKPPLAPVKRASTSVPELKPASRSSTDPSTISDERHERSHLSRRLHASSLRSKGLPGSTGHKHKHHHSVRHAAKNTVQSAIDLKPPTAFEHILRRDKKSPESSIKGEQQQQQEWDFAQQQAEAEARRVKPKDVEKLRERNEKRELELRGALTKVEELGMRSTRQLDDTYYSILEKAEMLRNTVSEMQRLAEESRETKEKADRDAKALETDIGQNLDSFEDFKQQEERVDTLLKRLADSKTKTEGLNDRLEGARKRVETYEKTYRETRAKRRKRWNITWGTIVGCLVVLIALLVVRNSDKIDLRLEELGQPLVEIADLVDEAVRPVTSKLRTSPSEDPVLESMFQRVV